MVLFFEVNWIAVIAAALASIVLGFLWYGPLFGKQWMSLSGMSQKQIDAAKKKGMTGAYVLMIISTLVAVCVLGILVKATNSTGISQGATLGFLVWLGFVATFSISSIIWEGKSWSLWVLNNAYQLINYLIIGMILAVWQ